MTSSRRELLLAGIAMAGIGAFPASLQAQADVSVAQFLALSEQLTATPKLDPAVAKTLLDAFLAAGNGPALATLVAEEASFTSHTDLADAIVAAWYSGLYDDGGVQKVATFTEALVWGALPFTKPFAECGGDTNYWALAPDA